MRGKRTLFLVLILILGFSVSARAALVDMGDGTIYDTDTQLSWLKDANYARTSGFDSDGMMTWAMARDNWIVSLNAGSGYAGFTNWRLPTSDTCIGFNCTGSEMGYLYYVSLGNAAGGPLTNTGPFTNVQGYLYWSGTEYAPNPTFAWFFPFSSGKQAYNAKSYNYYAWAVRPGARTVPSVGETPVGYNWQWLIITLASLTLAGGFLLRRKTAIK